MTAPNPTVEAARERAASAIATTIETLGLSVAGWSPRVSRPETLDAWLTAIERLIGQLDRLRAEVEVDRIEVLSWPGYRDVFGSREEE